MGGCIDNYSHFFIGMGRTARIFGRIINACDWWDFFGDAINNWNTQDSAGFPRLLDYALGVQPFQSSAAQLAVQVSVVTNTLVVQFPCWAPGTSELTYQLQSSPDLVNWSPWNCTALPPQPSKPEWRRRSIRL
jgi:hypothetical protein